LARLFRQKRRCKVNRTMRPSGSWKSRPKPGAAAPSPRCALGRASSRFSTSTVN